MKTIMKKIYIIPQVEILEEETQELLVASNLENGFNKSGAGTLDSNVSGGNLGRDYDFEDEE